MVNNSATSCVFQKLLSKLLTSCMQKWWSILNNKLRNMITLRKLFKKPSQKLTNKAEDAQITIAKLLETMRHSLHEKEHNVLLQKKSITLKSN